MNRKLRITLMAICVTIFLASAAKLVFKLVDYQRGDEVYQQAQELAGIAELDSLPLPKPPELPASPDLPDSSDVDITDSGAPQPAFDPYAEALRNMDFAALQQVNPEVIGWIYIPDTNISYPLVQGADNEYYLNHTWRKTSSSVGAIFLDERNSKDFSDFNTIIYGHRMRNNSMFGTLNQYKNADFWANHPYVYISTAAGTQKYKIFSIGEVSVTGESYRVAFSNDATKQRFLDYGVAQSQVDTKIVPAVYDKVLTLSTCVASGHATRWVVQARLAGTPPTQQQDESALAPESAQQQETAQQQQSTQPSQPSQPSQPPQAAGSSNYGDISDPQATAPDSPLQEGDEGSEPISQDILPAMP